MTALLSRLSALTSGDREVDALIAVHFDIRPDWCANYGSLWMDKDAGLDEPVIRINTTGGRQSRGHPPMGNYDRFTSSLDAALALVERLKPGIRWTLGIGEDSGEPYATLPGHDTAYAATPALALLKALLTAMEGET